jgi:hypothetical protein
VFFKLNTLMATELLLRIEGVKYYIVSADRLHPDQAGNIVNAPSSVLNPCASDTTCMSRLKEFLSQSTSAFDTRTMSNSDIIERAKQQIYQSHGRYYLATREKLSRPLANKAVIEWLSKAEASLLGPYSYLNNARNKLRLDFFDDNLSAAERYMEGQENNFNQDFIAGMGVLKSLREIKVGRYKPIESIFGKNGSQSIEFVTRWGMLGVFDLKEALNNPPHKVA